MRRFRLILCVVGYSLIAATAFAQVSGESYAGTGAALVKLAEPVYPRIALQARIAGTVSVEIGVRQDGSIESVTAIAGHPILKQAALDSARLSQYACPGCSVELSLYTLAYTFELIEPDLSKDCSTWDSNVHAVKVDVARHHVTVAASGGWICDPRAELRKVRSPKCLYLWHCGVREIETH